MSDVCFSHTFFLIVWNPDTTIHTARKRDQPVYRNNACFHGMSCDGHCSFNTTRNRVFHECTFNGVCVRQPAAEFAWNFHAVDIRSDSFHQLKSTSLPSGWTGPGMTIPEPPLQCVLRPSWLWCVHNLYKNGICSCTVSCLLVFIRYDVVYCRGDVICLRDDAPHQYNRRTMLLNTSLPTR